MKNKKFQEDDVITSESESESDLDESKEVESATSSEDETVDEKRNRLAKIMLGEIKEKLSQEEEDEMSEYLKKEILERAGKLHKDVADLYLPPTNEDVTFCRWSKMSVVTCVVISSDYRYIFSGSKDGAIIKWCVESGQKVHVIDGSWRDPSSSSSIVGHSDEILSLAASSDGKFLASGSRDTFIHIWRPDNCKHIHTFRGHKNAITGLTFRHGSHDLFSASQDKSIKIWNLDEMAYVETLFGHEDGVTAIDCLSQEKAVSSGGRDGSVRVWKVIEESHLVFHGHTSCIDCVRFVDDHHFISASDDNSIAVWSSERKKPLVTFKNAHGNDGIHNGNGTETVHNTQENWITSIAALHNSDLVASGSRDGYVRFWKLGQGYRSIERHFSLKLDGFINSLEISQDGSMLVAGVGKEHRLGRWFKSIKTIKNSVCIIRLKKRDSKSLQN